MRASQWILGLATAAATVACVASGCGGNTSGGNSPTDSGTPDVTADQHVAPEAAAEAAPEAASDAPVPCASDAMITSIPVLDGSVPGSDASAAACISCVETDCPMLIMQCNAICGCPDAFNTFEACVGAGGSVTTCGAGLLSAGLMLSQVTCAFPCAATCGVSLEAGSKDGAGDSSGDATGQ
jgi:hypothetical protein